MALFTLARYGHGRLDRVRRATFDNTRLFWHYTVAQSAARASRWCTASRGWSGRDDARLLHRRQRRRSCWARALRA